MNTLLDFDITVATAAQISEAKTLPPNELPRFLVVPATFTSTAIGIEHSLDGGDTWQTVEKESGDSAAYSIAVRVGRSVPSLIPLPRSVIRGLTMIRFTTDAEEAADRTLSLVLLRYPAAFL